MAYRKEQWGVMPSGEPVSLYTLSNDNGVSASFTDLGGTWVTMYVPDRAGKLVDVVLGYDSVEAYLENPPHFGAPIGRNANRIAGARFTLNGKEYRLAANDGTNNLHSAPDLYRQPPSGGGDRGRGSRNHCPLFSVQSRWRSGISGKCRHYGELHADTGLQSDYRLPHGI